MPRQGRSSSSRDRSLRRRSGTRQERLRVLVTTEGRVTEPRYFSGLSRHIRATGVVVHTAEFEGTGRDPVRVVRSAKARSERDGPFDAIWCVFDVDDHSRLTEAVAQAEELEYSVAVSNPCFEVWLVWHFEELTAYRTSQQLKRLARRLGASDEDLLRSFPYSSYPKALERGQSCAAPVPINPGSRVGSFIQMLCSPPVSGYNRHRPR